MIARIYSLLDRAARAYGPPMMFVNDEVARRAIMQVISGDGEISRTPGDFSLYVLGNFDTDSGVLGPQVPQLVCEVGELVAAHKG